MNSYKRSIFISFPYADPAGIVFFGHCFTLAHDVFESFVMEKLELSWKEWFQNEMWVVPIKQANANYFSPLVAGAECSIELIVVSVSTTAFSTKYIFSQNGLKNCEIELVHVFCDKATRKKIPIPSLIKDKLINLN